jgi:Lrp/AsnC family transcriptional regulator for asnA, asnC and gidA
MCAWFFWGGSVDRLDRLILQALHEDGRMPFTQIARQAGVSETTIRTRYHGLMQKGIVRTMGILDSRALGYEATAIISVSVEPGMAEKIARTIRQVPEVSYLVTTLGSYDLILEIVCRDLAHLTDVITRQIHPITGVRATETLMIAESHKHACDWSPYAESGAEA